ncbi:MAG: hypothetical protein WAQ05_08180 [Rubrivivax sp.]
MHRRSHPKPDTAALRLLAAMALLAAPVSAWAYIGPGLGAGVVAAVLGVLAGLMMLVVGVFWYPLKRLWQRWRGRRR